MQTGPLTYTNGTVGFDGLNNNPPNNCLCTPPDTTGSTGNGYVFETVNAAGQIWSTAGANLSSFNLQVLFKTTEALSDPNIHYDPMSGRWFAEMISVTNYGNVLFAVSTSSDPTSTWNAYLLNMPNHSGTTGDLPDQINIGVSANTVTFSGNDFAGGSSYAGAVIFVVNKTQAVAGTTPAYIIAGPWSAYASIHAGEELTSSGTIYMMSSNFQPTTTLNYLTLTGAPPSAYHFTFVNFTTSSTSPSNPTTPDGSATTANDNRMGSAVWRAGNFWGTSMDGTCSGGSASCIHLWEINTTSQTKVQDYVWSPPGGAGGLYPAVTLDSSNDLGLLYSFSDSAYYPSVAVTGAASSNLAASGIFTPTVVKAGTADGSSATRFGDYSGASTDMSTNTFWGFGEWTGTGGCTGGGCYEFDTWVQSWSFAGGAGPSVASFTASPPTFNLGGTTYLNVTAAGGTPPYSYAYSGLPTGCTSANTASLVCTPTATGTSTVTVTVADSASLTATGTATVTVNPSGTGPSVNSFTASPSSFTIGGTTYLNVSASGGTGALSYAYTGLPAGCTSSSVTSLSCTPTATGAFTVTVTVTDTASKTATGTTSFTVNAPPAPTISTFTASPSTLTLGGTTYINVSATGGTPPYTYAYNNLPTGCSSSSVVSLTCVPSTVGTFSGITVTVTDAYPNSVTSGAVSVTVNSPPTPTITSFTISPSTLTAGGTTYLNVTAVGGTAPYVYSYTGLPTSCASQNTAALTCIPTTAGTYTVQVVATDASLKNGSSYNMLTVTVAPVVIQSFGASPSSIPVGTATTFTVAATGGSGSYAYSYASLPGGCSSANSKTLSCIPMVKGTFTVSVKVTDTASLSRYATASATLTVTQETSFPQILSFKASVNPVTALADVYFNVSVQGGTLPYSYVYYGLPTGCTSTDTANLACAPTNTGTFHVNVTVTDAVGNSAQSVVLTETVQNSPSTTSGFLSGTNLLLLIAVIAAIAAIAIVLIVKSRKRAPPPARGPPQTQGNYPPWQNQGPANPQGYPAQPPPPPPQYYPPQGPQQWPPPAQR